MTSMIYTAFRELMPGRDDIWPQIKAEVNYVIHQHSILFQIDVDPANPTETPENCRAVVREAIARYKWMNNIRD